MADKIFPQNRNILFPETISESTRVHNGLRQHFPEGVQTWCLHWPIGLCLSVGWCTHEIITGQIVHTDVNADNECRQPWKSGNGKLQGWMFGFVILPSASCHHGCEDLDQVASITWHQIWRLQRSKSSSPTPKSRSNWMSWLQKAFSTQATSPKQHKRTPFVLPVSAMCQLREPVVQWLTDIISAPAWYPNRTIRYLVITLRKVR